MDIGVCDGELNALTDGHEERVWGKREGNRGVCE